MEWIKELILIVVTSLISGAGTFFFARSKYKQEVESVRIDNESKEIENLKSSVELYKIMIDDLRKEVNYLREKVQKLELRK